MTSFDTRSSLQRLSSFDEVRISLTVLITLACEKLSRIRLELMVGIKFREPVPISIVLTTEYVRRKRILSTGCCAIHPQILQINCIHIGDQRVHAYNMALLQSQASPALLLLQSRLLKLSLPLLKTAHSQLLKSSHLLQAVNSQSLHCIM